MDETQATKHEEERHVQREDEQNFLTNVIETCRSLKSLGGSYTNATCDMQYAICNTQLAILQCIN